MVEGKLMIKSLLVSPYTHKELRELEDYPRESFNNIILRLINSFKKKEKE